MKAQKTYFGEEIDRIILTSPNDRTRIDNEKLLLAFQSFPYLIDIMSKFRYGDLMVETVVKLLRFKEYKKGEIIFRKGELISSMYIVCHGEVTLFKPTRDLSSNPASPDSKGIDKFKMILKAYLIASVDKNLEYMYSTGEAIGQHDILSGKKRPSLCEAYTNCIIGELSQTDYFLIFERTEILEKTSINTFLNSLPFFAKGKKSLTEKAHSLLTKKHFNKGDYLFKQGDPFDNFYIIRKGSFQVSLKTTVKFFSYFDMHSFFNLYKDMHERFASNRLFELNNSYKEIKEYKLINFGTGKFLGNFEHKLNTNFYLFTVQCLADNSEVFELNRKAFEKQMTPFCNEIMLNEATAEMTVFQKRLEKIKNVQRQRGDGNKYKSAIVNKIRMKEEKLTKKKVKKVELNSKHITPLTAINNSRVFSANPKSKLFLSINSKFGGPNSKNINSDYTVTENTTNYQNMESFATCDSNYYYRSKRNYNSPPLSKIFPSNLVIKKALLAKKGSFYRPQTSKTKTSNYDYFTSKRQDSSYLTQDLSQTRFTQPRLLSETSKINYSKCLEINKGFVLKNNSAFYSDQVPNVFSFSKK